MDSKNKIISKIKLKPNFFYKKEIKGGFTLVELMVTVGILSILGSVAFLSFNGFLSKSRDSARISDITNLSKGLDLYSAKAGKYPLPEGNILTGVVLGADIVFKGNIQDQISNLADISKAPKDPILKDYYIYGVTHDRKQYQIAATLENKISLNNDLSIQTAYADSTSYTAKIIGNYRGLIVFNSGADKRITNIPSLIYNTGSNLLSSTGTLYSTDKNTNLPYLISNAVSGNKDGNTILQELIPNPAATLTGILINGVTNNSLIYSVYAGELLTLGYPLINVEQAIFNTKKQTTSTTFTLSDSTIKVTNTGSITDNCSLHPTYLSSNTAVATISGTTIITLTTGTSSISPVGGNCDDKQPKLLTVVTFQWQDVPGSNCNQNDVTLSGGTIWAGCNSVIGSGMTYAGTNNCYNYNGLYTTGSTACHGNTGIERTYNSTYGVDNIWGKLYLWSDLSLACKNPTGGNFSNTTASNSNCPCPTGWHVPTDDEFKAMEKTLNGGVDCRTTDGWQCPGLGWSGYQGPLKSVSNNIIRALNLPLSGYRNNTLYLSNNFRYRGSDAHLWSSTQFDASNARVRLFNRAKTDVYRFYWPKTTAAFSVRCVKNPGW